MLLYGGPSRFFVANHQPSRKGSELAAAGFLGLVPWEGKMIEGMKTQVFDKVTYHDRWIKPMEGLNAGTAYASRPPGSGLEPIPWDASLNKDVGCAVGRQVAFCSMMESTDTEHDKRFTRYTPKTQGTSYLRILDPAHGTRTRTNTFPDGTEANAAG